MLDICAIGQVKSPNFFMVACTSLNYDLRELTYKRIPFDYSLLVLLVEDAYIVCPTPSMCVFLSPGAKARVVWDVLN